MFQLLREQISLVNTPEFVWDNYEDYTNTERRRSLATKYDIPIAIIIQLKEVREKLINNKGYYEYAKDLPEVTNYEYLKTCHNN